MKDERERGKEKGRDGARERERWRDMEEADGCRKRDMEGGIDKKRGELKRRTGLGVRNEN